MPLKLKYVLLSTVASLCLCVVADGADIPGGQVFYGDTTIEAGDTVTGSITVVDGNLTVYGTVEKNITQIGPGNVYIAGYFSGEGIVNGNIREDGEGYVATFSGDIGGNITELDEGFVSIDSSIVAGNISEQGDGPSGVDVYYSLILGNIFETGSGSIIVQLDSTVYGNLREEEAGDVLIGFSFGEGLDLITGNIYESGPGDVLIDSDAVVEGNIESE